MPKGIPKSGINKGWLKKGHKPHNFIGRTRNCLICSSVFKVKGRSRIKNGKYCSSKCYGKSKKGKPPYNKGKPSPLKGEKNPRWNGGKPNCKNCGKELSIYKPKRFMCMECISKNSTYRNGTKAKKWAEDVKKRDDYTCQGCGERGCYLESHHIKSWTNYPKLRFKLSNGGTLCRSCHEKTDNYAYKAIIS